MAVAFSLLVLAFGLFLVWKGWKGYSWRKAVTELGIGRKA